MIRPDNALNSWPKMVSSKIWITKTREHEKDKRIVHHDDPLFARFLFVLSCFRDPFVFLHLPYTRMAPARTRCHTASMIRPDNASNSWPMIVSSKIWITKTREHEKDKRTERILHYDNPVFARFPFVLSCFRDPFVLLHPPYTRTAPARTRCRSHNFVLEVRYSSEAIPSCKSANFVKTTIACR